MVRIPPERSSSASLPSRDALLNHAPWAIALGFAVAAHFGWFCPGHGQQQPTSVQVVASAAPVAQMDVAPSTVPALAQKIERIAETHTVPRALAEQVYEDPSLLTDGGRVRAVRDHGKPVGLRVERTKRGGILRLLGLRDGDVIKSIDGKHVRSLADVRQIAQCAHGNESVTIVIRRSGTKIRKRYRFE